MHAAADVGLSLLEHAPILQRHPHVAGVRIRIGIFRIHHVATLAASARMRGSAAVRSVNASNPAPPVTKATATLNGVLNFAA